MEYELTYESETLTRPSDPETCRLLELLIDVASPNGQEYEFRIESIRCPETGETFELRAMLEPDKTNIFRLCNRHARENALNVFNDRSVSEAERNFENQKSGF